MACSREISLINFYINFLVQKDFYRYSADILKSLSENKIGMKYCLDFLSINWKTIIKIYDIKELSVIFKSISNENEYKVVSETKMKSSLSPQPMQHLTNSFL